VAITATSCINGLPESISLWEEDSIPNGTIAFVNDQFRCDGIITHVSVGYEVVNDDFNNGRAVFLQLKRRKTDSNNFETIKSIPLPMGEAWNETDDRYILNDYRLPDAIQFQENDIINIFTPANAPVKVLVDVNSANSSRYIDCTDNQRICYSMSISVGPDLLSQSVTSGALQIKITTSKRPSMQSTFAVDVMLVNID